MAKSSYERILDSVESVLERNQLLIKQEKEIQGVLQPVFKDAYESIKRWLQDVSELKREHSSIQKEWQDTSDESRTKRMVHVNGIQWASYRPQQLSKLLTFSDCYKGQIKNKHISKESLFAKRFIEALLKRVELELLPVVVFSDGFFIYDSGDVCIFTIPYLFYNSYVRWVNLAHEVGHLFIKRKCQLDVEKLGSILIERVSDVAKEMERGKAQELMSNILGKLIMWLDRWADEIASDCIAVFLCGIGYMNETIMQSFQDMFQSGSGSHPPTGLRLACQIEIVERMGVDVTNLQQFRENLPQFSEDPIMESLTDLNLAPLIITWVLEHDCISKLKSNWTKITTAVTEFKDGKTPKVDLDIGFGALSYLTNQMPTKTSFEKLRNKSEKNGE